MRAAERNSTDKKKGKGNDKNKDGKKGEKETKAKGKEKEVVKKSNKPKQLEGKGRRKGVTFEVKPKIKTKIETAVQELCTAFDAFGDKLDAFTDKGNKSAARDARKHIMTMLKAGKTLRILIQEGKDSLIEKEAS